MSRKFTSKMKRKEENKCVGILAQILTLLDTKKRRQSLLRGALNNLVEEGEINLEQLCPRFEACQIMNGSYVSMHGKKGIKFMYEMVCSYPYYERCREYVE